MALSISWLIQLIIHALVLSDMPDKIQTSQKREGLVTQVWLTWIWGLVDYRSVSFLFP